jgi:[acyl-carrier-protein] S-malonyltransferase
VSKSGEEPVAANEDKAEEARDEADGAHLKERNICMGKLACLFPGQGSQSVGMGRQLFDQFAEARTTFEEIDRIAGRSLSQICFDGPDEELKRTINTQPTILAASLAAWRCYEAQGGPKPDFVAGHSLGELTALVVANVLTLADAVRLVEKRARLMEECPKGAMSAVIGVSAADLDACVHETEAELQSAGQADNEACVVVANFNTREQLVISGNPNAVAKAGEKAKAKGGKVIPLPVGGAFHSPLMVAAAKEFSQELQSAKFNDAIISVVQNYDALPAKEADQIKAKLAKQISSAVRWCESVETMLAQGVDTFVEIGPGKVLTGTVKKIDKSAKFFNVYDAETLKAAITSLKETLAVT